MNRHMFFKEFLLLFLATATVFKTHAQDACINSVADSMIHPFPLDTVPLDPIDPPLLHVLEPDTTSTSSDPVGNTPAMLSVSDLGAANYSIQISLLG